MCSAVYLLLCLKIFSELYQLLMTEIQLFIATYSKFYGKNFTAFKKLLKNE